MWASANKWMVPISRGKMEALDEWGAGAKQVRSAEHEVSTRSTIVRFRDGSESDIKAGDGA